MRKGCRTSKYEKKCSMYSYPLGRCKLGRVKYTCPLIEQPKKGTKKAREAQQCRDFYKMNF
jgi:hypothetical protein